MAKKQIRKLSDVKPQFAAEGANDSHWFLMEHQLHEAQIALAAARQQCEAIGDLPENEQERELARDALEILSPAYIAVLHALSSMRHYLAGTEVAEAVGRYHHG